MIILFFFLAIVFLTVLICVYSVYLDRKRPSKYLVGKKAIFQELVTVESSYYISQEDADIIKSRMKLQKEFADVNYYREYGRWQTNDPNGIHGMIGVFKAGEINLNQVIRFGHPFEDNILKGNPARNANDYSTYYPQKTTFEDES